MANGIWNYVLPNKTLMARSSTVIQNHLLKYTVTSDDIYRDFTTDFLQMSHKYFQERQIPDQLTAEIDLFYYYYCESSEIINILACSKRLDITAQQMPWYGRFDIYPDYNGNITQGGVILISREGFQPSAPRQLQHYL